METRPAESTSSQLSITAILAVAHVLSAQTPELDLAQKQIDANDLTAATATLESYLKEHPASAAAWIKRGNVADLAHDDRTALADYDRGRKERRTSGPPHLPPRPLLYEPAKHRSSPRPTRTRHDKTESLSAPNSTTRSSILSAPPPASKLSSRRTTSSSTPAPTLPTGPSTSGSGTGPSPPKMALGSATARSNASSMTASSSKAGPAPEAAQARASTTTTPAIKHGSSFGSTPQAAGRSMTKASIRMAPSVSPVTTPAPRANRSSNASPSST